MKYDYELDDNMRLHRYSHKTGKYTKIAGLYGNDEAAIRVSKADLAKIATLAKARNIEVTARFSGSGPWIDL